MDRQVYNHSVEALLKALRPVLDDGLKAELKGLGIDVGRPLLPLYGVDVVRRALALGAQRLAPGRPEPEQLYALGLRYVDAYSDTVVGQAMKVGIRLIGPRRSLDRLAKQLRSANTYGESRVTHEGDGLARLWCSDVSHPEWYRGVITRLLQLAGASDVRVALEACDDAGATFRVEWF